MCDLAQKRCDCSFTAQKFSCRKNVHINSAKSLILRHSFSWNYIKTPCENAHKALIHCICRNCAIFSHVPPFWCQLESKLVSDSKAQSRKCPILLRFRVFNRSRFSLSGDLKQSRHILAFPVQNLAYRVGVKLEE